MQVVIQVFSSLRDCLPPGAERGRIAVELPEGSSVLDLFDLLDLNRCLGGDRRLEDEMDSWQVSLNGEFLLNLKQVLHPGDQVLVFPHMAGGCSPDRILKEKSYDVRPES